MSDYKGKAPKPHVHVDLAGHDIVTSSNITSDIGIAVGRVYQDSVTVAHSRRNGTAPAASERAPDETCSFDELYAMVAAESEADPAPMRPALERLWDAIIPESPDAPVDVRDARAALAEITAHHPTDSQRQLLLGWLSHTGNIPQSVIIIARRVLG